MYIYNGSDFQILHIIKNKKPIECEDDSMGFETRYQNLF
jgi:hypothetical protein